MFEYLFTGSLYLWHDTVTVSSLFEELYGFIYIIGHNKTTKMWVFRRVYVIMVGDR